METSGDPDLLSLGAIPGGGELARLTLDRERFVKEFEIGERLERIDEDLDAQRTDR